MSTAGNSFIHVTSESECDTVNALLITYFLAIYGLSDVTTTGAETYRNPFVPEHEPLGFFPSMKTSLDASKLRVPIHGGSVPNSAIIKRLYPPSSLALRNERTQLSSGYRPPVLTAAQSAFLSGFNKQVAYLCLC